MNSTASELSEKRASQAKSPLYLDVRRADYVRLEGVALRVDTRGGGRCWYPLRCVSRVIVTGRVDWETPALLACLQAGIPVAFRQRDGTLIGHCVSDASSRVDLEALLISSVQSVQGQARYRQWLAMCWQVWRQRFLALSDHALHAPHSDAAQGHDLRALEAVMWQRLDDRLPCSSRLFRDQVAVLVESRLSSVLLGYGFSDNVHVPLTPGIDVYRDLSRLLLFEVLMQVAYQKQQVTVDALRGLRYAVIACFQQYEVQQEACAREYVNKLWRHLKEDEVD